MKVSLLLLTIDRFETTTDYFEKNWINAKDGLDGSVDIELLVCDNGSNDRRVVDYFAPISTYHRINSKNEGCARASNQLFLRSHGDIISCFGSDNLLPTSWLQRTLEFMHEHPKVGNAAISDGAPPANNGRPHLSGTFNIQRSAIETCGFYSDDFDVYGFEDQEFNYRLVQHGYELAYVPDLIGHHVANLECDNFEYRKMKFDSYVKNSVLFESKINKMKSGGPVKEPMQIRDAL